MVCGTYDAGVCRGGGRHLLSILLAFLGGRVVAAGFGASRRRGGHCLFARAGRGFYWLENAIAADLGNGDRLRRTVGADGRIAAVDYSRRLSSRLDGFKQLSAILQASAGRGCEFRRRGAEMGRASHFSEAGSGRTARCLNGVCVLGDHGCDQLVPS